MAERRTTAGVTIARIAGQERGRGEWQREEHGRARGAKCGKKDGGRAELRAAGGSGVAGRIARRQRREGTREAGGRG